jgi:hypothetical protein
MGDTSYDDFISISALESPFFFYTLFRLRPAECIGAKGAVLSLLTSSYCSFLYFFQHQEHYLNLSDSPLYGVPAFNFDFYTIISELGVPKAYLFWIYNFIDSIKSAQDELRLYSSCARLKLTSPNILVTGATFDYPSLHKSMYNLDLLMEEITGVSSDNALSANLRRSAQIQRVRGRLGTFFHRNFDFNSDGARKNLMIGFRITFRKASRTRKEVSRCRIDDIRKLEWW